MKVWVFDLDGTLVDSFQCYIDIVHDLFEMHGKNFTETLLNDALGTPAAKFLSLHLGAENLEACFEVLKKRSVDDAKRIKPFPGMKEFVEQLTLQGKKIAVWTSRDFASATDVLNYSGLAPHVGLLVSSCCIENHKPHPEGLNRIGSSFNCDASEIVVIGDHDFDIQGAKNFGALAVRASWHSFNPPSSCRLADQCFSSVQRFTTWADTL